MTKARRVLSLALFSELAALALSFGASPAERTYSYVTKVGACRADQKLTDPGSNYMRYAITVGECEQLCDRIPGCEAYETALFNDKQLDELNHGASETLTVQFIGTPMWCKAEQGHPHLCPVSEDQCEVHLEPMPYAKDSGLYALDGTDMARSYACHEKQYH